MREDISLALDGSAIAFIALALWLALQRRGWPGVLFGVLGLALMSGNAAFRAYPNPTRADLKETADALRAQVAATRAEIVTTINKLRKAEATGAAFKRKVGELKEQTEETESRLAEEAKGKLRLSTNVRTLRAKLADALGEADKARTELDKVRSETLSRLTSMMSDGLSTKFYRVAALPERELILGKLGAYYSVRLKDRSTDAQFVFAKGRYSLPASEASILEAINRLARDVLQPLNAAADHQVYLRGGADAEPMTGSGEVSAEYSAIAYRVLRDDGRYATALSERPFQAPVSNKDLPVLRAAYFRSVVAGKLPAYRLEILDNAPSPEFADEDRTVEIILYVNW